MQFVTNLNKHINCNLIQFENIKRISYKIHILYICFTVKLNDDVEEHEEWEEENLPNNTEKQEDFTIQIEDMPVEEEKVSKGPTYAAKKTVAQGNARMTYS